MDLVLDFFILLPVHASSVPLVLNTSTTCVSPQFHYLYDDKFAICKKDIKFKLYCQYKAKFKGSNQSLIDLLTNNSTYSHPSSQNFEPPKVDLPFIFKAPPVPVVPSLAKITYVSVLSLPVQMTISSKLSTPSVTNSLNTPSNITKPSINSHSGRQINAPIRFVETPLSFLIIYSTISSPTEDINSNFLLQPSFKSHEPHPLLCWESTCLVVS